MTEAEKELLEATVRSFAIDPYRLDAIGDQARRVISERLPSEYEQTLRAACFRAWEASEVARQVQIKGGPIGDELTVKIRKEWDESKRP